MAKNRYNFYKFLLLYYKFNLYLYTLDLLVLYINLSLSV